MNSQPLPRPIHILSDGDALHRILHQRLAQSHDATMSVISQGRSTGQQPNRTSRWAKRHIELDGITGLTRAALAGARPGLRLILGRVQRRREARSRRELDASFMTSLVGTDAIATIASPDRTGTLITFGSIATDIEATQHLRLHFGWPPHPGRDGVYAALTHRDVGALCTVIEATGMFEGYSISRPPLGVDDDPIRIHQRLVALGAEMTAQILDQPSTSLSAGPPAAAVVGSYADRGAVRRDVKSGRLSEVIRSVTRF